MIIVCEFLRIEVEHIHGLSSRCFCVLPTHNTEYTNNEKQQIDSFRQISSVGIAFTHLYTQRTKHNIYMNHIYVLFFLFFFAHRYTRIYRWTKMNAVSNGAFDYFFRFHFYLTVSISGSLEGTRSPSLFILWLSCEIVLVVLFLCLVFHLTK